MTLLRKTGSIQVVYVIYSHTHIYMYIILCPFMSQDIYYIASYKWRINEKPVRLYIYYQDKTILVQRTHLYNILAVYYISILGTYIWYILYSAGIYNVLIFGQTASLCTVIIVCNLLTLICPWCIKTVLKLYFFAV